MDSLDVCAPSVEGKRHLHFVVAECRKPAAAAAAATPVTKGEQRKMKKGESERERQREEKNKRRVGRELKRLDWDSFSSCLWLLG